MEIRAAVPDDLPAIERIYAEARAAMARSGNPTQWGDRNPPAALVRQDIALGRSRVCTEGARVVGVFALVRGDDPTYAVIDGAWHSDRPYATLHRIAAADGARGVFDACLAFCKTQTGYLRADTHADNAAMLHLLASRGFARCGVIRVADSSARIAFDLIVRPAAP